MPRGLAHGRAHTLCRVHPRVGHERDRKVTRSTGPQSDGSSGAEDSASAPELTGGARASDGAVGPTRSERRDGGGSHATSDQGESSDSTILQLLRDHGFNYVRLRTFVDPKAADGYDRTDGYGGLAHTIAFGKRIKDAGMGLLIDFHYSDNWADPGKQCVPVAWQKLTSIAALANAIRDYTRDAVGQLVSAGARPDMVQIGNEINWEPTRRGPWNEGHALFDAAGSTYTATKDLEIYDAMKTAYAERL